MPNHPSSDARSPRPPIVVLSERELRENVPLDLEGLLAVEEAFAQLSSGRARSHILVLKFPARRGQVDIKTAPVTGEEWFAVKVATGFYENRAEGLPNASGFMAIVNTHTGFPEAILLDNGYLTAIRTALAGAVAAKHLAPHAVSVVGVIGAGLQGRLQIHALRLVRSFRRLLVFCPRTSQAEAYVDEMHAVLGIPVAAVGLQELVESSDVLVTTTPATRPLVKATWLHPGLHITAMGSDTDEKQELEAEVLHRADVVCCDDRAQCARIGELRSALAAGLRDPASVIELGELALGSAPGRTRAEDVTVCDLTGMGVQDTAIARLAYSRAVSAGLGLLVQS